MTSLGLKFLDIFTNCLHNKSYLKKKKLTEREAYVISRLYDFEDCANDIQNILAIEFEVSSERIRQIATKGLKKLRKTYETDPIRELRLMLTKYSNDTDQINIYKTFVRFCLCELNDIPFQKIVKPIIYTCLPFTKSPQDTLSYCVDLRNESIKGQRRLDYETAKKKKKDERFMRFLDSNVLWLDKVELWEKSDFMKIEPKRAIVSKVGYKSGLFFSHKMKREVQYESGAELEFIQYLESCPSVVGTSSNLSELIIKRIKGNIYIHQILRSFWKMVSHF